MTNRNTTGPNLHQPSGEGRLVDDKERKDILREMELLRSRVRKKMDGEARAGHKFLRKLYGKLVEIELKLWK